MNQEAKVIAGIGIATIAIIVGGVFFFNKSEKEESIPPPAIITDEKLLIGESSYKVESEGAKVIIVEFGDYQCPACAKAYPVMKKVLEDYKGKITFVYRNFPLPSHNYAMIAAQAAEAAGAQGKYWEMYDKLFENQIKWSSDDKPEELFNVYASEIGLDSEKFNKDLEDKPYTGRINKDRADGEDLGVNSTPTFFINGEKLNGVPTYETFKTKIDPLIQ